MRPEPIEISAELATAVGRPGILPDMLFQAEPGGGATPEIVAVWVSDTGQISSGCLTWEGEAWTACTHTRAGEARGESRPEVLDQLRTGDIEAVGPPHKWLRVGQHVLGP